jgi:flagellar basal body-associated protein FliL
MKKCDHFRVTTGRRKKSLTIISVIIVGLLIVATVITLPIVLIEKDSTTTKEGRFL